MWKKSLIVIASLWVSVSQASIVITGTRVIYPSSQKNVNVQLDNNGNSPSLVQAWIDNGNADAAPEQIKTPFLITPPVSRVDAQKGQTLRITYTGETLPMDRESVFYLNVLDIPPKPKANPDGNQNYLQIAIRSRIKLFFRPDNLAMQPDEAYNKVEWHVQGSNIMVNNPTPYFITYNSVAVKEGGKVVRATNADMVAPFSQASFNLTGRAASNGEVQWTVVNDYGGLQSGNSSLR